MIARQADITGRITNLERRVRRLLVRKQPAGATSAYGPEGNAFAINDVWGYPYTVGDPDLERSPPLPAPILDQHWYANLLPLEYVKSENRVWLRGSIVNGVELDEHRRNTIILPTQAEHDAGLSQGLPLPPGFRPPVDTPVPLMPLGANALGGMNSIVPSIIYANGSWKITNIGAVPWWPSDGFDYQLGFYNISYSVQP